MHFKKQECTMNISVTFHRILEEDGMPKFGKRKKIYVNSPLKNLYLPKSIFTFKIHTTFFS